VVNFSDSIESLFVEGNIFKKQRNLHVLSVDESLLRQPQTVLYSYLPRMEIYEIQLSSVFQDLHCPHQVDLILIHSPLL
jgi:hypothetical protein